MLYKIGSEFLVVSDMMNEISNESNSNPSTLDQSNRVTCPLLAYDCRDGQVETKNIRLALYILVVLF